VGGRREEECVSECVRKERNNLAVKVFNFIFI
jgi:hypothetical protein